MRLKTLIIFVNPYHILDYCANEKPAGLEDGSIGDNQITVSSFYPGRPSSDARLKDGNFWAVFDANPNRNHWIQITFMSNNLIKGIRTQGAALGYGQWVKTLQVQTGDDVNTLKPIQEAGSVKVSVRQFFFT